MNKIYTLVSSVILSASLWAQAPQKMSYQSVVRGTNNALVIQKTVGVKITILQGSETGASVYSEIHSPTSNSNGLVAISIGGGKNIVGDFTKIDWSKGPYFIKTETDVSGGTNYQLSSVSELMSVPYALFAANNLPGPKGDTGVQGPAGKDGVQGLKGDKGDQGPVGKNGLQGVKGDRGVQGVAGKDGVQGLKGDKGDKGAQGPAGKDGLQGLKGDKGDQGIQGAPGVTIDQQKLSVSDSGDTLYLQEGGFVLIPGLSAANPKPRPTSGYGLNITDAEGNSYKTVYIGTQQWMAENLKTGKFSDGTLIPNVKDDYDWSQLKSGAWSYYNNDSIKYAKYGKLYNWFAISKTTNGKKNVCPTGWHVPTDAEWTVLTDYLGGLGVAGGKLKEVGTSNWSSPNGGASNSSLFTGLPGGYRYYHGMYSYVRTNAYWWSTKEIDTEQAITRYLYKEDGGAYTNYGRKNDGLSVRCLRD